MSKPHENGRYDSRLCRWWHRLGWFRYVHCRSCRFFDQDMLYCILLECNIPSPGYDENDEGSGGCAWGVRGEYDGTRTWTFPNGSSRTERWNPATGDWINITR